MKTPWRRKWQPTPVLLPGEFHGQRSLAGYNLWGRRVKYDWATTTFIIYILVMTLKQFIVANAKLCRPRTAQVKTKKYLQGLRSVTELGIFKCPFTHLPQFDGTCLQCSRPGFSPWVGKIPWRRESLPTPVFLPGESHGQRTLEGYWGYYSPWQFKGSQRIRHDWAPNNFTWS